MDIKELLSFLDRVSKDLYRYGKTGDSKEAIKWRRYLENAIRSSSSCCGESSK